MANYTDFADPSTHVPLPPGIKKRRICLKLEVAEYSMISGSGMGEWSALFPPGTPRELCMSPSSASGLSRVEG